MRKVNRFEAHLDDYGIITAYLSKEFYSGRSDVFYVRDLKGTLSKCSIYNSIFIVCLSIVYKFIIYLTPKLIYFLPFS